MKSKQTTGHKNVNCPSNLGYVAIFGGITINLTMGMIYVFGNILPYLASFMASNNGNTKAMYDYYLNKLSWIFSIQLVCNGLFAIIGAKCETIYGARKTASFGCSIYTLGILMTYFSVNSHYSFIFTFITFGIMSGIGVGIMYISPIVCVMKWFPNRIGFVVGFVLIGFGISAPLFDFLLTMFMNPNNIKQDINTGFLNQSHVLNNIPIAFIKLAAIICSFQMIGISCLFNSNNQYIYNSSSDKKNSNAATNMEMIYNTTNDEKVKLLTLDIEKENYTKTKLINLLKNKIFWNLYLTMFTTEFGMVFTTSQWKIFINHRFNLENDRLLMLIGAVSISFNAAGRIIWGTIFDHIHSYKLINGTLIIILSIFIATFPLLSYIENNKNLLILFCFIWLSTIYFCLGGINPIYMSHISNVFGAKNAGINFSIAYTCNIPAALCGMLIITSMRAVLGWVAVTTFIAGFVFIGFILVLFSNTSKYKQSESVSVRKTKLSQDKMRALSYLSM